MNFTRLVENGTYKKEDLTPDQQAFISGMEEARGLLDCVLNTPDSNSLLEKLVDEIQEDAIQQAKQYLYSSINESIVCFLDNNAAEEEMSKVKK